MTALRSGLLGRLLLAIVAAAVLAFAAGATALWHTTRNDLRAETSGRNAALAIELAARIDARMTDQVEVLGLVASRGPIRDLAPDAGAELQAVLATSTSFDELVLYDLDGTALAAAATRRLARVADEPDRADLVRSAASSPALMLGDGLPPDVEVAVPVQDPPGTPAGVLVARLPLDAVASSALRLDTVLQTTRMLVDGTGRVLVHPERDRVLRAQVVEVGDTLDSARGGRTSGDDGVQLIGSASLRSVDGAVVVALDERSALEPLAGRLFDLTVIFALVMGVAVIAVAGAGAWLLAPAGPLAKAVRRLGGQERGVRIDQPARGELAVLASEFNRLAASLDERAEQLDELRHLSLMVNSRTSHRDVAHEVAAGAMRLLNADGAAFCSVEHGPPELLATEGAIDDVTALALAATASRLTATQIRDGFSATPLPSTDGPPSGALVITRSRPLAPEELALAEAYASYAGVAFENVARLAVEQAVAAELADAVEQRRSLMSSVSHELRTPLACIDAFSMALLERWDTDDDTTRRDMVEKIRHHSDEVQDLVSRLLDFAMSERGHLTAELERIELPALVDSVVTGAEPMLAGREVDVEVDAERVHGDPVLLRRALTNLLSNAVKYSAAGTPIRIRSVDEGPNVRIEIHDHGIGMTADEAGRAFQPFWRAGTASTRSQRGAGLGLALVAEYARAMEGGAGVVSEPGHGSIFFVTLPRLGADVTTRSPGSISD